MLFAVLTLLVFVQVGRADLFGKKKVETTAADTGVVFNMHLRWSNKVQLEQPYYDKDSVYIDYKVHHAFPNLSPLTPPHKQGL